MWRSRKAYQVIDDEYDDNQPRACSSILSRMNAGRNLLFGNDDESQPLVPNRDSEATVQFSLPTAEPPQPPHMASSNREEMHHWDHIVDLDQFFARIYDYHQGGGYLCICTKKILELIRFIFIVFFSTFFTQCVDYNVLFANRNVSTTGEVITGKRHFNQAIYPNCAGNMHPFMYILLLAASAFWMLQVVKAGYYLLQIHQIQLFYKSALGINDSELPNRTWHSVLHRLCEVQSRLHLAINCDQLKPIDVYNRILRFKNYFVALVNQRVLPPVFTVPFMGKVAYLPNGLKALLKRSLFYGSTSPWNGPCLKDEYKNEENLRDLATELERRVAWYSLLSLVLIPFTFIYQILYSFFLVAEMVKKSPDTLGMRRYSNYGKYRVRHFNEMNHELESRLNRSHVYANAYMNQFYSQIMKIVASHIRFMVGAIALVLGMLGSWDEDVLQIEHVLTVIVICGGIFLVCNSFIPEENLVYQPEVLLNHVTSELHYLPPEWKGQAHTEQVRREFEEIFQLKWMFLLHELSSPIITPFVLYFWVRPRCRQLVEFFYENTVTLHGLGDICSFALLDVAKHGDPAWDGIPAENAPALHQRALDGKTEMSVLHFASTNPDWRPPRATEQFLNRFRAKMGHDASLMNQPNTLIECSRNLLAESVHSLLPVVHRLSSLRNPIPLVGEGLMNIEGPIDPVEQRVNLFNSFTNKETAESLTQSLRQSGFDVEAAGADMRLQTLYLRGLHDEIRQSMAPSTYGTSIIPNERSLFGVPTVFEANTDESVMEASVGTSRMQMRPTASRPVEQNVYEVKEEEEENDDDDDDERPPTSFLGV